MSSQDRLENVLRDIHVMISKSEVYDTERIIIRKNDMYSLIDRLNASIYEIMDEYELTQQSRDRALRENKKEGDKIIWDASRQAEDIYAASVLYTEEALNHLNRIVEDANDTIGKMYRDFGESMKQQQKTIRENQLELKSQLQLLADTEKYLNIIDERNKEIEREEAEKHGRKIDDKQDEHAMVKPEIKINEEYFRRAGIPLAQEEEEVQNGMQEMAVVQAGADHGDSHYSPIQTGAEESPAAEIDNGAVKEEVKADLDAEYFKWKTQEDEADGQDMEEGSQAHHEKTSFFDKLMGKKRSLE